MTIAQTKTRTARPPIHLLANESERLAQLAMQIEHSRPELAEMLLDEIDRAKIHREGKLPPDTVSMGSEVEFVDESSGQPRVVQLVYPHESDIDAGRISILTPIGAGLIGLRAGQSILWPDLHGHQRLLRIVRVSPPAAA